MDVLLDSALIGSQKHLLCSSDGFTRLEKIPEDVWHFSGNVKQSSTKCWDTILLLNGETITPKIPSAQIKAMNHVAPDLISPPWSMVMPPTAYRKYLDELIMCVRSNIDAEHDYYEKAWVPSNKILNSLRPSKVDSTKISEIVNSSAVNAPVVETFRQRGGGYAAPVIYDRFGTVTGRLIVESGPNILLLKKEYRSILKPSHPEGRIISIDFSSLEARILLYESGNDCLDFDLYGMLAQRFGGLPRNLVKAAVLSVLYGSSKAMVAINLGVSETKVVEVIQQIEKYIDTKALVRRLKEQHRSLGYIKNRYGRRLNVERPQDNIFISYYAQSTGVDVSLMGFGKVIEELGLEGIRPLFVLHDALILDVHPDRLDDMAKINKINVPGYDQAFPLKIEEISK